MEGEVGVSRNRIGIGIRMCGRGAAAAAALLALAACQGSAPEAGGAAGVTATGGSAAATLAGGASADAFTIVDCQLPGQVRRLGTRMTFVSRRPAIKTPARDCAIRGGEYVAYDRADYQTALSVWLPAAEGGDAQAQTYVGDIYEKGLGTSPDYAKAAEWYRKAAQQGFAPAQIALGALYEQGRGVPRDQAEAYDLYQKATGLGANFVPASQVSGLQRQVSERDAEVERLRRQLAQSQRELDAAQGRLRDERRRIEQTPASPPAVRTPPARTAPPGRPSGGQTEGQTGGQSAIDQQQAAAEQARVAEERKKLEEERRAIESQGAAEQARVVEERQKLERQRAEIERESARLQQLREESARLAAEQQQLQDSLAAGQQSSEQERAALREAEARALAKQEEVSRLNSDLEQQQALFRQQEDLIARRQGELEQQQEALRRNEQAILARQAELERKSASLSALDETIAEKQAEVERLKHELAAQQQGPTRGASAQPLPREPRAAMPSPGISFGRYYALVIGSNNYASLPNLETAVADAQAVASVLRSRYGFDVTTLTNATRYDILSALNTLRGRLTENDNLLIYYAGHGEIDRSNQRGYWLPVDAEPESTANWVSNVQISDTINTMSAKHVIVIADSCYSGALTRSALASLDPGMSSEARREWIRTLVGKRARTALTSGGLKPVVDSVGGQHSIFAEALLEALRGNSSALEGQRLFRNVSTRVTSTARARGLDQTPQYAPIKYAGHAGGDFFFVPVGVQSAQAPRAAADVRLAATPMGR